MNKNYEAYKDYKLADFLADETFKRWVINPNDKPLADKWFSLRRQYPHLIPLMDTARSTIMSIRSSLSTPSEDRMSDWIAIERRVAHASDPLKWRLGIWWSAAVICLFAFGCLYFTKFYRPMVIQATVYGEEKEIVLPDGSKVMLYPHSTIRYAKTWEPGKPRQVWVEGEAHFSVAKISSFADHEEKSVPFAVHLNDSLSVTVLGTEFLVYNREKQAAAVQLESGMVRVDLPDQTIRLLPGEAVTYLQGEGLVKQSGPLAISRIGQTGELALDNARVDEATRYIESTFGISVHVATPFLHRRLDGIIPFASAEEALQVLADILDGRLVEHQQGSFQILEK